MNKYLKNQKGFIVIPVIVWWLVGATVLVGGTAAVKSGYVAINLQEEVECPEGTIKTQFGNNFECLTKQEPTSGSVLPVPSPKKIQPVYVDPDPIIDCKFTHIGTIKLRGSVCQKSTDCQIGDKWIYYDSVDKCKADQNIGGSRTGSIIKYKEFCKAGQEISIYQNELITKKASDGNTYSMTLKDWGCFENSLKNKPDQAIATTYNTPTPYTPPQYYSCTICYSALNRCETYTHLYKTKEECTYQQSINNSNPTPRPITEDQAQVTINQQIYEFQKQEQQQANGQCKSDALSWYQVQIQNARARFGGSGSAARAAQEITKAEYDRNFKDCDALYPI